MAATSFQMLELGTSMPEFSLPDTVSQKLISSAEIPSRPLVVAFICNHCPFVKHIRDELAKFGRECKQKNVAVLAISSNDAERYPDDAPARMAEEAEAHGFEFPYLFDESQKVAQAFRAVCTPEFYLFNAERNLVYRGQFDDSRPGNGVPATGSSLRRALEDVLSGREPGVEQKPSVGCSIKWKPGNTPEYL